MAKKIILVIGPASCGKSEWAEYLASHSQKSVTYVATGTVNPEDAQWQAKIERHIQRRPPSWQTLNVPIDLAVTIANCKIEQCFLVDSLGTWLANLLEQNDEAWEETVANLLDSLTEAKGEIIFVGEETGWGVVPAYPTGRLFRDRLGKLIRILGSKSDQVYLVTGGYVLDLSALGKPLPY